MTEDDLGAGISNDEPFARRTYTIEEVASLLGIGRNAAYSAALRGDVFPVIKIGKRVVVPRAAIDRMLAGT
jgi:predicted DNA-binding transcriptional regulator AlpA